jgi:hypothetical protein
VTKLVLLDTRRPKPNTKLGAHRASATEGEAVKRLLEEHGYPCKRTANQQMEFRCPFHEGPGSIEPRKGTNFYVHATNGVYTCHSASCGERGNLQTLERFFGVGEDDAWVSQFRSREEKLKEFQRNLTTALRTPFYEHGLTDSTIDRFRLGYEPEHDEDGKHMPGRYVIPYLEGRRPQFFRYYQPGGDPKWKYTWETGAESTLYNGQDAMGDKDGKVFLCEGEMKAMLLVQMGYAAVAVPGASQWKDEFQAKFTHARQIIVCYDNDNPEFHVYDKPDEGKTCHKCKNKGIDRCSGHNPGQEAALARVEQIGWRAKNVVLPLPSNDVRKTDINDYFMRDGHTNADFAELATGKRATPFKVQTLAEIHAAPPEEASFLVEQGILPVSGRLLIAGKPKVGKSIFVDNLALSLAAGIPFLGKFKVDHPTRTLLLDRELSKRSLYERLTELMADRVGYKAAMENLMIDHDHLLRLDQENAYDTLLQLVEQNGAEVVILDTAYKFLGGDIESSKALSKAFEVLDHVIHETGCSIVMTHHLRKSQGSKGRENTDVADPDNVAGSFLWTGWPNATILLNYLQRSVENPFNSVATFTAFRDHAAPEPLALYRSRESISYQAVQPYSHDEGYTERSGGSEKPTTALVQDMLLEACPTTEEDFLNTTAAYFGVSIATIRPLYLDAMTSGAFERTNGRPPIIKFKYDVEAESWEREHGLAERPLPDGLAFEDVDMFDTAAEFD